MNETRWLIEWCRERLGIEVSEFAVEIALAAKERGINDSDHDWKARNAIAFQHVLDRKGVKP